MLLYYAVGGGLGHLTRARAVLHTLGIDDEVVLLTSSAWARDSRVTGGLRVEPVPDAVMGPDNRYRAWLASRLDRWQPAGVFVDAFPGGLCGELCGGVLGGVTTWHLARRLQWDRYRHELVGSPPPFAVTYRLEPLEAAHAAFLDACSADVRPLALEDPPATIVDYRLSEPFWLVAHSGPPAEVAELLAYARDTRAIERSAATIAVATPIDPEPLPAGCVRIDVYPASALFARAERIFTAAGFNAMRQTTPWRHKHRFVPFPRRFDDQFTRAAAARCAGTSARPLA